MEGGSKEILLQEIFENKLPTKFAINMEKLAALDAFLQFAQNPTSMSAGYGIEENYPFIERNLSERYDLGKIALEAIISFLKESVHKMKEVYYDVYFWRNAIEDYIRSKHLADFIEWYSSVYESLSEVERKRFLFLLYALSYKVYKAIPLNELSDIQRWHACFFDKEERITDDKMRHMLVRLGLGNILYYRSSKGDVENVFVPSPFLADLCKKFRDKVPIGEKQVEEFFSKLSLLDDIRLLDLLCSKESIPVPVLEGRITQTFPLVVEASKSYFAISPFVIDKLKELIKTQKLELTKEWKKTLDEILNSFVKKNYPCAELKVVFEKEGAYCWKIRYVESPERESISIGVLLAPYIFKITPYSTILDEARRQVSSRLNLIFLIKETFPTITDSFRYVNEKNLIFLLNEREKKFYFVEKSCKLHENEELSVSGFLSRFLPLIESKVGIGSWPSHLKDYLENLKYLEKFPRLVNLRNSIPSIELELRRTLREKLERTFGEKWIEEVRGKLSEDVKKLEKIARERPDKIEIRDFLDGATLGELIKILRTFEKELNIDRSGLAHLDLITQHRKLFEHPIKDRESDIDEEIYRKLKIALEYVEKVICLKT